MRILFAIAALAAIIGFAQPAEARDWSIYVGAEGGYSWSESDAAIPAAASTFSVDTDGATGGVFAGFETRVGGPWTFGLEGNWLAAGGDGSSPSGTGPGDTYNIEQNWTASVRGRVAYEVTPETQVYAEAGVAWADVDAQLVTGLQTDSATMTGWTVGVGLQHDYSEHVFVRAGYRYYDYDSEAFATALPSSADLSSHTAMIGVGWRFNT